MVLWLIYDLEIEVKKILNIYKNGLWISDQEDDYFHEVLLFILRQIYLYKKY